MIVTVLRNRASRSGRALANALGAGVAQVDSRRTCRGHRYVINWGVGAVPTAFTQRELTYSNTPNAVRTCANKLITLETLWQDNNAAYIEYATREGVGGIGLVQQWLEEDGKIVVRHSRTGHSGHGIEIVRRGTPIPNAPLYTRYFRKQAEYRLHVFYGRVILTQQKRRMNSERRPEETPNSELVRTHANGWCFTVNNLDCDTYTYRDRLNQLALSAANAVGANHCAVDILVNHERDNDAVVCEINSAPGIEAGSTLEAYTEAFRSKIEELS